MTAWSYGRIVGANDRIQIGQIGCGHRAAGHRRMLKMSSETDSKFDLRSIGDLWSVNREMAADEAQELFGKRPKTHQYSEELLADSDLDAVMIGTGDHQHAKLLAEVVKAGKDCYCEKPMANTLEDAKLGYNLGNLWRRLGLPNRIKNWSLTSLQHRLMKTGGRLVKHAHYYWLLLAEGHPNRKLFGEMLGRIWALPVPGG